MTLKPEDPIDPPKKQTIYNWLMYAWNSLTPKDLIKSFIVSGISISMDGNDDLLLSNVIRLKPEAKATGSLGVEDQHKDNIFLNDVYSEKTNTVRGLIHRSQKMKRNRLWMIIWKAYWN